MKVAACLGAVTLVPPLYAYHVCHPCTAGKNAPITQTFDASGGRKTVLAFFTHFGDFNSFEYAEKLLYYMPRFEASKVEVVGIGIGTTNAGAEFARLTGFPIGKLYAVGPLSLHARVRASPWHMDGLAWVPHSPPVCLALSLIFAAWCVCVWL